MQMKAAASKARNRLGVGEIVRAGQQEGFARLVGKRGQDMVDLGQGLDQDGLVQADGCSASGRSSMAVTIVWV